MSHQAYGAKEQGAAMNNQYSVFGIKASVKQTMVQVVASGVERRATLQGATNQQTDGINQRNCQ